MGCGPQDHPQILARVTPGGLQLGKGLKVDGRRRLSSRKKGAVVPREETLRPTACDIHQEGLGHPLLKSRNRSYC